MSSTASSGIALLAIAWLAVRQLSGVELGYFFSFLSFGSLIQLGDFGLSYASLQTAGHLAGTNRLGELSPLARLVAKWSLAASLTGTALAAAIGTSIFMSHKGGQNENVVWIAPWVTYLLCVFAYQLVAPQLSLREGAGKVAEVWSVRLTQEWTGGIACLAALYQGWGLWSLPAYVIVRGCTVGTWLLFRGRLDSGATTARFGMSQWMTEVWPFQWKMGLSGLSGFLIFRAFSPIVLMEKGPLAAGQFGLAVSLMNLLITTSSSWPLSQAARFAALHASGGIDPLRRDFPHMVQRSTILALVAAVFASVGLWQARRLGLTIALKLPDPVTTTVILLTAVIHHFVTCFAVLLRSEGREPLLVASIGGGILTVVVVWVTAHFGSMRDLAIATFLCASIGIPIVLYLFRARNERLGQTSWA